MSRETNCFDLFETFSRAVGLSGNRTGRVVSEQSQSIVWLAFCDEHRAQGRDHVFARRVVKRPKPVEADGAGIVLSGKRKVKW